MRVPDVCAVVVTFQPDPAVLAKVLDSVAAQVGRVVLVDNGSPGDIATMALEARRCPVEMVRLPGNRGIAAAQNIGIERARRHGFRFVLLLDQDSIPKADMVLVLSEAMADLARRKVRACAVGPMYVDPATRHEAPFVRLSGCRLERIACHPAGRDGLVRADFLISSGSLIPLGVLAEVGGMDESLFIDHVDTDWCFRARSRGYQAFGVCRAVMEHSLGSRSIRVRGFREHHVAVRSPLRLYYIVRNSLSLYRRPHVPLGMRVADGKRLVALCLFFGILVPPRLQNLHMMLKGAWHAVRGVSGRYGGK